MSIGFKKFIIFIGDIFLAYLSLVFTVLIGFWKSFNFGILIKHFLPFTFLYFFWFVIFYIFDLYELLLAKRESRLALASRIGEAALASLFLGAAFFYAIPFFGITPKTNLLINIIIFYLLAFFWRLFFYSLFSAKNLERVYFLGDSEAAKIIIKKIEKEPYLGYKFIGFLNQKKRLLRQIKSKKANIVIVSPESLKNKDIIKWLYESIPLRVNFVNVFHFYEDLLKKTPIDFLDYEWFLENLKEGKKKNYDKVKRIMDIIFAFALFLATIPFWLIVPILIKLDSKGPVFFKHTRVGRDGRQFSLWKFRSMFPNPGEKWTRKNDKRITRIGKILRKTHIDELPQIINIIKGDISFVGPRPEIVSIVNKIQKRIPYYELRHIVKPGITGWAQIKYKYSRTLAESREKLQYDLYYIKNRNLLLDIEIVLKTIQIIFKGDK